jgi:hypothetical protein
MTIKTTPLDLSAADHRMMESFAAEFGTTVDEATATLIRAGIQRRYIDPLHPEQVAAAKVMTFPKRTRDDAVTQKLGAA